MRSVVIVEDDPTYLSLLRRAIKLDGLDSCAFLASCAAEFRSLVKNNGVGLVIFDVNLQEQETGFDLLQWLRLQPDPPPAYLQSWTVEPSDLERARALGSELRPKPTTFTSLRERLREWVAQASESAPGECPPACENT